MSVIKARETRVVAELPDGTYEVRCTETQDDEIESVFSEEPADIIRLFVEIVDHVNVDGGPIILDPIANRKLTPKTKLWGWFQAFGIDPEIGKDLDTETMVGRHALALVQNKISDGGGKWPKVVNFMPLPRAAQKAATKPQEARSASAQAKDYPAATAAQLACEHAAFINNAGQMECSKCKLLLEGLPA